MKAIHPFLLLLILPILAFAQPMDHRPAMVLIPAGSFIMGDATGHGASDETPRHTVTISYPFSMSATEITQAQWRAVMGTEPGYFRGDQLPVEMVSWFQAVLYCNALSVLEGLQPAYQGEEPNVTWNTAATGYRLPTEAEWEFACRAGTTTDYHAGNMRYDECTPVDPVADLVGWYCGNASSMSHPVGSKQPNAIGLYDMHGNVTEWCWDWYGGYSANDAMDPLGPDTGVDKVIRGGSWYDLATITRSSTRIANSPGGRGVHAQRGYGMNGFRIARGAITTSGLGGPVGSGINFHLEGNYPNPFSSSTTICFTLTHSGPVTLTVHDMLGRQIASLVDSHVSAGRHEIPWRPGSLAPGVVSFRLSSGTTISTALGLVK